MKKNKLIPIISLMVIGVFSFYGCSGDYITAPEGENQLASQQEGIPADEINFIPWTNEFSKRIRSLNKNAASTVLIEADEGGTVGGPETFGNKVEIPSDALDDDTEITVSIQCMNDTGPCIGVAEFLPDTQFNKMVLITMSYAELDYSDSPYDIKVYWKKSYNRDGWTEVEVRGVDTSTRTFSFEIDHFTQYAWGL